MNVKKIAGIMLCTAMLFTTGIVLNSCNSNDDNEPDNEWNGGGDNDNDWDNGGGSNGGDNGGNNGGDSGGSNGGNNNGGSNGGSNNGGDSQTKPNAPSGLQASVGGTIKVGLYVNLRWDNDSNADSYVIYRATSANGSYSKIGTSEYASYTDNSPKDGDNYYKVTAKNSKGESAKSDYAMATIDKSATKPEFKSIKGSVSGNNIKLSWTIHTESGYGKPARVEAYVYDPTGKDGEGWYILKTYTGSSITSGSHTYSYYPGYLYYNSVRMALVVANEHGEEKRTITYIPETKTWSGTF